MLRLSLREPTTGTFLARVVERDGVVFVLDFGDPVLIADINRRLSRGFTVWHMGTEIEVDPDDTRLLTFLAEHYAASGLLVAIEEPGWSGREPVEDGEYPEDAPTEFIDKASM